MKEFMKNYFIYLKKEFKKCSNDLKSIKTAYKQVPNILTIIRLLSTLPINIFFFTGNIVASLVTCGFAAFTDLIDGQFARKYNCSSQFGADLDAICDKLFILLMALPIVIQNPFMLLNIGLETGITFTNVNAVKNGKKVKSSMIGKIKTWILSLTVLSGYLLPLFNITPNLIYSFLITIPAVTLQTATLIKYIRTNNAKPVEKRDKIIKSTGASPIITRTGNQKQFSKVYSKPATIEELKQEREKLLQQNTEKGHQKIKTDLK